MYPVFQSAFDTAVTMVFALGAMFFASALLFFLIMILRGFWCVVREDW